MSTGIEWTDETWNPTTGCDRTSPGCDHCYALDMAARLKAMGSVGYQNDGDPRTSGPGFALTEHPDRLDQPLRWTRPRKIFVNSMSDLFHPNVTSEFIAEVWAVMALAKHHQFQVLTKRAQAMRMLLANTEFRMMVGNAIDRRTGDTRGAVMLADSMQPNVWVGTSIESDEYAFRANHLRQTPAAVRFLSCEPLLGPLPSLDLTGIDWVIVGGESGPKARPMHPDWARDIRDRCVAAGVPFLFKQWGEWTPYQTIVSGGEYIETTRRPGGATVTVAHTTEAHMMLDDGTGARQQFMWRAGKKRAGRELDGRTWDEYPKATT